MSAPQPKRRKCTRARRYALTFFKKPSIASFGDLAREGKLPVAYFLAVREICPETKKEHWQSYVSLTKPQSFKQVKALFNDKTVHIEKCKGSEKQNISYCKKGIPHSKRNDSEYLDGNVVSFGKPKEQGARGDLIALRDHFKSGGTSDQAIEDDELVATVGRYIKFADRLASKYAVQRSTMTELHIYWGVSGSGKSHKAFTEASEGGQRPYYKPLGRDSQWWDGYHQQDVVILEDFRGEISLGIMLRLIDKYPLTVPFKGGYTEFNSKKVVITSNLKPEEFWNQSQKGYEEAWRAMKRRITKRVHFNTPYVPPKHTQS